MVCLVDKREKSVRRRSRRLLMLVHAGIRILALLEIDPPATDCTNFHLMNHFVRVVGLNNITTRSTTYTMHKCSHAHKRNRENKQNEDEKKK